MLKAIMNEARLRLDITTQGPLLVKTGYATVIGTDMAPVQTFRNGQSEVYLPGSTLKGIFRSHIEKVINSIRPQAACNPLSRADDPLDDRHLYRPFCGGKYNDKTAKTEVYSGSCPTCRLFGSTWFSSRITIEDAYLPQGSVGTKELIEHRDGIAIDRLTGGTGGGAKFDLEVVAAGKTFTTAIHLRNFEIWQLGMLFVIIQDMEDELIRIGSGRSRGLGKVKATISEEVVGSHDGGVVLSSVRFNPEKQEKENEVWGLGHWLGSEHEVYGTQADDMLHLSPALPHTPRGIRNIRVFKGDALESLKQESINIFAQRIQAWPPPEQTAQARTGAQQQQGQQRR
jgi:CRISPR-associated RAMP protein (TIGR02581 family)